MHKPFFPEAAIRTITASRSTILKARIFGKKLQACDDMTGAVVTAYMYKGHYYFTSIQQRKVR